MLLEAKADASTATQQGATALQLALRAGHDALAEHLVGVLDSVAALNAADMLKWTALHCAAQRISLPAVEMLIKVCPCSCTVQAWWWPLPHAQCVRLDGCCLAE